MKIRTLMRLLPLVLVLGLISCSTSLDKDSQGWVLMRYYTNDEKGLSGIDPLDLGDMRMYSLKAIQDSTA